MKPYYVKDNITIYNGDCADILPELKQTFDVCLMDIPYGIGESSKNHASRGASKKPRNYGHADWDKSPVPMELVNLCMSKAEHTIMFGGNYYPMPASSCWLVWDKMNGACDFADAELIFTTLPGAVRLIRYQWSGFKTGDPINRYQDERYHPTQKPVDVMRWCIEQALKKNVKVGSIIDPFMGSGTTLMAAQSFGIPCVGIEREQRYCDAAIVRLEHHSNYRPGMSLFD